MAISNISVTRTAGTTHSVTIGASGNNRCLIIAQTQARNPVSMGSVSLNGSGIGAHDYEQTATNMAIRLWALYDADLPSSGGAYDVTSTALTGTASNGLQTFYCEGAAQTGPSANAASANTGSGSISLDLTAAATGAFCMAALVSASGVTHTEGSGVTEGYDAQNTTAATSSVWGGYSTTVETIAFTPSSGVARAALGVAIDHASSGPTGDLDATESGDDTFEADGGLATNGVRLTLRDTDTGALAASLTDLIVSIRANSDDEATLVKSSSESTDGSGIMEFASGLIGDVADWVYVTVEKSDNSIVAAYRVQVVDLTA